MQGLVYGVEVWGDYRVTDWWRLSAGFNVQHEHFRRKTGSTDVGGVAFVANDPNHQASLRSSIDLGQSVTWDTFVRYVGALHNPALPEYVELNARVGWKVTPSVEISVSGFNLIHARHAEFVEAGVSNEVPRSFFAETRVRF